jgi:2,3-bisphosphoglycerate-independent phosphoglycerate mutase
MIPKKHIPTALIILDGFGFRTNTEGNAIALADTPNLDQWLKEYPHALLKASGSAVGLPDGVMGNSEVGHSTIGCGRIIEQPLTRINNAIKNGSFFTNSLLIAPLKQLKASGKTLHIMGLISDAGIHSNTDHMIAYIQAAVAQGITNIIVHAFLDGRDTPPRSAEQYLETIENALSHAAHGVIGSIHGRFYAMDRDHQWDRTEKSYRTLTQKQTDTKHEWREVLKQNYAQGITDEFIPPTQLTPSALIDNDDGIIFANIRPDRARQLTSCFVDPRFKKFKVSTLDLSFFITPVDYGAGLKTTILFPDTPPKNTLKDVLAAHEKTMFSIAETEKYAHVTYFFSGGNEKIAHHEMRILIPSIKAITYAKLPAMSAPLITQAVIKSLRKFPRDFYLINYANADMVGHSGNLNATIKAIEVLDIELKKLYDIIVEHMGGIIYITADHGKAEQMIDSKTGQPRTAHTTNPVPFIMIKKDLKDSDKKLSLKGLSDIAPFILENMGIKVPDEMR